jgi:hypothetical protein
LYTSDHFGIKGKRKSSNNDLDSSLETETEAGIETETEMEAETAAFSFVRTVFSVKRMGDSVFL